MIHIFLLWDEKFTAYPLLGAYSTLEGATKAAQGGAGLCIYEEVLDTAGETIEPVHHIIEGQICPSEARRKDRSTPP